MAVQIQIRRDTSTNWINCNPIIADGEHVLETDTGCYKRGDGINYYTGLTYIYCFDYKRKVEVYPTPHNIDKIEYKDEAENCFGYKVQEVKCPSNKSKIEIVPLN